MDDGAALIPTLHAPPRRYDIDLLGEEVVVKWHAQDPGKFYVPGTKVREAAAPFIKWLGEAEVEE